MPEILLDFSDASGLTYLVPAVFLFLLLFRTRLKPGGYAPGLSTMDSRQLQGICILAVIVHHISQRLSDNVLPVFQGYGYLAVGVFFLVSGYGLIKSRQGKKDYLDGFFSAKFLAVLLPFLLVNAVVALISLSAAELSWYEFWSYFLSFRLIDETSWFIVTIFLFYSAFFLCFRRRCSSYSLLSLWVLSLTYICVCLVLNTGSWFYKSALCFPLGATLAFYEQRSARLLQRKYLSSAALLLAAVPVVLILWQPDRFPGLMPVPVCLVFAAAVYLLFSALQLNSPVNHFLGGISLELYLLHMKILLVFSWFTALPLLLWSALFILMLVLLAYVFHLFCTAVLQPAGMSKKRKKETSAEFVLVD